MVGNIRFEHSHRLIAGFVGLLTFGLCLLYLFKENRRWVKLLAVLAVGMVILQAVLGGITVLYLLPTAVSVFHATLAQTFFCLISALALVTSADWRSAGPRVQTPHSGTVLRLTAVTTAFIYIQLVLGAIVRHTRGFGFNFHFLVGFLIAMHVLFVLLKIASDEAVRVKLFKHAALLGVLTTTQVFLGFGAFVFALVLERGLIPASAEVFFRTAHQSTGALVLCAAALLTIRSYRHFRT